LLKKEVKKSPNSKKIIGWGGKVASYEEGKQLGQETDFIPLKETGKGKRVTRDPEDRDYKREGQRSRRWEVT